MKKGFPALLALCASLPCGAAEYYVRPTFSTSERYNTNIYMLQKPPQDNWITTLSPGLNFGLLSETQKLTSNFTWNRLFYTNQSELDIDEQLLSVNYQGKSERMLWKFDGSYNNRSSLSTEGTVLGNVRFTQVMAKQLSLAPSFTYALNEGSTLSLNYSYNRTTYEQNTSNIYLANYDYHQVSGIFRYHYTERDVLDLTLSGSRYKTPVYNQTTDNYVAQLGWQHNFSEQLTASVSAGFNYAEAQSTVQVPAQCLLEISLVNSPCFPYTYIPASEITHKRSGFGQVFQVAIEKGFAGGSVSLIGSQNQTPTSQGLQTRTQVGINGNYTISEHLTSSLSANYSVYEITGQTTSPYNRTYYSISPRISWKWTPEIDVGLSYTYRQQAFQNAASPSEGNIVELQFTYHPQINTQVK
jgi:hypothetical protein